MATTSYESAMALISTLSLEGPTLDSLRLIFSESPDGSLTHDDWLALRAIIGALETARFSARRLANRPRTDVVHLRYMGGPPMGGPPWPANECGRSQRDDRHSEIPEEITCPTCLMILRGEPPYINRATPVDIAEEDARSMNAALPRPIPRPPHPKRSG